MDVVLVGLPGSGKTEVGRRLASTIGAAFVDIDAVIEADAGASIAELFARDGEAGFRARERAAVEALGPPGPRPGEVGAPAVVTDAPGVTEAADVTTAGGVPAASRVIAAGGGTVVDPRNRWRLYRGRAPIWLDAPSSVLAAHLGSAMATRPLLAGGDRGADDAVARLEELRAARLPFYAAGTRVDADAEPQTVAGRVAATLAGPTDGSMLLRVSGPDGRLVLGDRIAGSAIDSELRSLEARRVVLLSEPGAWNAVGANLADELTARGWPVEPVMLPPGEDAKRLGVVASVAGTLARLHLERDEPLVAIGGGALTDAAGFVAATFARGVPWIAVPTTLVGQIDAAIGGKTAVDLPEGKNLVGAFHRPVAVVIDVALLASLPERERRAALAEAVKVGVLGEPRLLELLEEDGPALAAGSTEPVDRGVMAELVERCARFKLDVVGRDPEERGERVALNLGHSLGHAIEAAGGFGAVHHGEAVAYGLRAASRIGVARGILDPTRGERIEALLDALALGGSPLPYPVDAVLGILAADKKRRDGRLRWVLPTDAGWTLDDDVPDALVARVAESVLAGRSTSAGTGAIAGAAR